MSDHASLPWQPWQPNDLAQPAPPPVKEPVLPEVSEEPAEQPQLQMEEWQSQMRIEAQGQGYAEGQQRGFSEGQKTGYEAGFQQGLAEAQQQQAPLQARMQQLVSEFHHTLEGLDSVIASRLMQLALEAARQVIGQAPHVDGTALLRQIQEMLQKEPMLSGKPTLRVHPDDLPRVESTLGATLSLHGWRLLGDSTLHPGGCKVSAEDGDLDASIATRWHELCRLAAPGEL
ncbi:MULTISPECIES: flagellar assembly protein FliH [Erwinia]|uniref:Flagellar assembly protein FliH n=1 Tax=Erwinia pyrifoliae TaxID=79967 RepID=A0ABY5X3P6_ERWPY|nr:MULTISPECIES: flagellar assembly protein FliH [Erwinia]ADP12292.1 flagellar assembly protein H [Erwinia sp. Ejp617]AUX72422.1 flagellar assembly protein FliH [Erwinia pyrifoliae]MCA8877328.1 flagellar assembly protein FliH [Erwinia pyrifoliae]MCT2388726.1 flagellar assembly protein FliH [Erwinia pyrifoliae]MCU8586895.1 flagellar assembly protein FliH [Erwinia pyrifoliae]